MTSAAKLSLRLAFLMAISLHAQPASTDNPVQMAEEEAVRRQEATVQLHRKLEQAHAAQMRNELPDAAKLYQEAVALIPTVQVGSPAVDAEKQGAITGLDAVRDKLAREALATGNVTEALTQVDLAVTIDPNNEALRHAKGWRSTNAPQSNWERFPARRPSRQFRPSNKKR